MKWSDFFKGFFVGAATGAVMGVLLAPKSGKETREDIKDYVGEVSNKVEEGLNKMGDVTREKYYSLVDSVLDSYEEAKKITKEQAEKMRLDLRRNYSCVRNALEKKNY